MQNEHPIDGEIRAYYDEGREDARLRSGRGRLEFWRTQALLRRWLPAPPAQLLDIGGGSGVYAEWLAASGYDVRLIDPVPLHVEQAQNISGVRTVLGDARSLDVADESVDAALLLGPLYHLPDPADRLRALTEAARVVRPGGIVVAAVISRFASMHDSLRQNWLAEADWVAGVESTVADGKHHGRRFGERNRFTTAYFHRPDEIAAELDTAGLAVDAIVAVEGAATFFATIDDLLDDPATRAVLMRWLELVEGEPSLLGASGHLLALGRRLR